MGLEEGEVLGTEMIEADVFEIYYMQPLVASVYKTNQVTNHESWIEFEHPRLVKYVVG